MTRSPHGPSPRKFSLQKDGGRSMPERLTLSPPPPHLRPPAAAPARLAPARRNLLAGWAVTSALSLGAWIITETLGGLVFLAGGVRLWRYHITPVLWQIASPV